MLKRCTCVRVKWRSFQKSNIYLLPMCVFVSHVDTIFSRSGSRADFQLSFQGFFIRKMFNRSGLLTSFLCWPKIFNAAFNETAHNKLYRIHKLTKIVIVFDVCEK